ncbi:hypothetical protein ACFYNW_38645 [Streptomyces virginiae]|uniref:hypothetical protein n=1 Tax=Streptomyces virginiae TaxID=1961 RepID=UPI0036E47CC4
MKRIFERLLDEHDADEISYQMVRGYVATRREEIRSRPAGVWWSRSSRRPTNPEPRRKSTSAT